MIQTRPFPRRRLRVLLLGLALLAARAAEAVDPGLTYPSSAEVTTKHGSVLIYSLVSSSATDPAAEDTRLAVTNRSTSTSAAVRLFFVEGATGSVTSSVACLTPAQTASVRASTLRAGVTGFVVAVAVNSATGCPVQFNQLAGQAQVQLASGFRGTLPALGVAAQAAPSCGPPASLVFDGVTYNQLSRELHVPGVASRADEKALLVVNRIGGDLGGATTAIGGLQGTLYDDVETPFSFASDTGSRRQLSSELDDAFPPTTPPFGSAIAAGRSGWLRLNGTADVGLTGAVFFFEPPPAAVPSGARTVGPKQTPPLPGGPFTGAHPLGTSALSLTNTLTFTAEAPGC
jgi:hypothetical protein